MQAAKILKVVCFDRVTCMTESRCVCFCIGMCYGAVQVRDTALLTCKTIYNTFPASFTNTINFILVKFMNLMCLYVSVYGAVQVRNTVF